MRSVSSHVKSAEIISTSFKMPYRFIGSKINPALLLYKYSYLNPSYYRQVVVCITANSQIRIMKMSDKEKDCSNERPPTSALMNDDDDVE